MNNKSIFERMNNISGRGPEKWLSRSLDEDFKDVADHLNKAEKDGKDLNNQILARKDASSTVPTVPQEGDVVKQGARKGEQKPAPAKQAGYAKTGKGRDKYFADALKERDNNILSQARKDSELTSSPSDPIKTTISSNSEGTSPPEVQAPSRTAGDYQWSELAVGAYLADQNIETIDDLRNHNVPLSNIDHNEKYLEHLENALNSRGGESKILKYLKNLREMGAGHNFNVKPEDIYISRTNHSMLPDDIRDLVSTGDRSDVFFRDGDGQIKGIDVKQDSQAYLGHPVVETFLDSLFDDRQLGQDAGNVKAEQLRQAEVPTSLSEFREQTGRQNVRGLPKEMREGWNDVYRNPDNAYHNFIDDVFREHPDEVIEKFLQNQFIDDERYPQYIFDGTKFDGINRSSVDGDNFEFQRIHNPGGLGEESNDAKSWYAVLRNGEPFRKFEIRMNDTPWTSHKMQPQNWKETDQLRPFERQSK